MKNKIITLLFLLITLSVSLSVSAKEQQQENYQQYLRIPMGISANEFTNLCPNVTPTPAELKRPGYNMYFSTEPLIIFEQEIAMIQYLFKKDKLAQVEIYFKNDSPEQAEKLLQECFKFYGKGEAIVEKDNPTDKFIAYSWDNKHGHTMYMYFYKENSKSNLLRVASQDYRFYKNNK